MHNRVRIGCVLVLSLGGLTLLTGCPPPNEVRFTPTAKRELQRRSLDLLLRAGESEYEDVRVNALEALVDVAPQPGLVLFRGALKAPRPIVRFAGLVSLGRLRDRESLPQFDALARDPDARVRVAAAFAALRCGAAEKIYGPILVQALDDNPDEAVRAEVAYRIGQLGESRAMRRLHLATDRERSTRVAVQAWGALAMLGDTRAVDRLIAYTQGDRVARTIALQTLVELRNPRTADVLRDRLSEREEFVLLRLIAARALGRLGFNDGYDLAIALLDPKMPLDIADPQARFAEQLSLHTNAALALGAIGDERALGALERLAQRDEPPVQVAACYAILQILQRDPALGPVLP
jgi:HEAT repeat protein